MNQNLTCPHCGQPRAAEDVFCQFCGKPMAPSPAAAETIQSAPPELPPAETSSRQPKRRAGRSRTGLLIGCAVLGVLGLIGVVALVLAGPWLMQNNPFATQDRIVLGVPNRAGEMDIYLMRLGQTLKQGLPIAENITASNGYLYFYVREADNYRTIGFGPYTYGGFVPGQNAALFWYIEDGDVVVQQLALNQREPTQIISTSNDRVFGSFTGSELFLMEAVDQQQYRCYISHAGEKAERLGKGNTCLLSEDGRQLLIVERSTASAETTATLIRTDGAQDTRLLDDEKSVGAVQLAPDASQLAYVKGDSNDMAVIVLDTATGEQVDKGEDWRAIGALVYAPTGHRFAYVATDSDNQRVLLLSDDQTNPLVTEYGIGSPRFSSDGRRLLYITTNEDNERTLWTHALDTGDEVEVLTAKKLAYTIALDRLFIATLDDTEFTLSSAALDGSEMVELYREDDVTPASVAYLPGDPNLYVALTTPDFRQTVLVLPINRSEPQVLVEEWAEVRVLARSPNGRYLAFAGREDSTDDIALYAIEVKDGASPTELDDDADDIRNALFSRDGQSLVYTAVTGSNPDNVEIRQVRVDGRESYETVYDRAVLIDAQWRPGTEFQYLYLTPQ